MVRFIYPFNSHATIPDHGDGEQHEGPRLATGAFPAGIRRLKCIASATRRCQLRFSGPAAQSEERDHREERENDGTSEDHSRGRASCSDRGQCGPVEPAIAMVDSELAGRELLVSTGWPFFGGCNTAEAPVVTCSVGKWVLPQLRKNGNSCERLRTATTRPPPGDLGLDRRRPAAPHRLTAPALRAGWLLSLVNSLRSLRRTVSPFAAGFPQSSAAIAQVMPGSLVLNIA